jgi:hypothetical protein
MKKKYIQFIWRLTTLTAALALLAYLLQLVVPDGIISPALLYLFILFYAVTAMVHYILLRITVLNPRKFVGYFMLATFLKLLIYLIVMVVYVFYTREGVLPFILAFFILYIIYTAFEVVNILAQTKD